MSDMKNKLSALTSVFVEEVIASIAAEMEAALSGFAAAASPKRSASKRGAPRKVRGRAKGAKRDPKALAALTDTLEAAIRANPGVGIEAIGVAMGVPTKELALPMKKLLAGGKIKTKGARRATKYFPAGGASKRAPAKKKASKRAAKKKGSKKASSKKK